MFVMKLYDASGKEVTKEDVLKMFDDATEKMERNAKQRIAIIEQLEILEEEKEEIKRDMVNLAVELDRTFRHKVSTKYITTEATVKEVSSRGAASGVRKTIAI